MQELALYRKYRPQTFKDVLGQDHVVNALKGAIAEGNVGHAYLFFGSRGTGKTSIARIFARELGASDTDINEIDAASYTGVDNIRALREEVQNLPFESERKVYIVDEVHMLSKAAFNAFLKTLEEPPKHVVFILATTELDKVPDTVQSRCQTFTFKKPTSKAIAEMVTKVAKAEGFTLEKASAELIGLIASGSFRDALSVLQKILTTSSDKKVSVAEVESVTGAPKGALIGRIIQGLGAGESEDALKAVHEAVEENADFDIVTALLLERVRILLLLRYAPSVAEGLVDELTDTDKEMITGLAEDTSSKINSETLRRLIEASIAIRRSPIAYLPLELAIIELAEKTQG
ncbi:DNA polymerase III, subunit gamma and tau [Candidatus Kaiserbacteria bacterium CG10_big_fil_rev_8_21_14_0_10_45_20]|uniref:DNA polymerase III subunit gamma/tau n=1 Tax=Candidatus Kaiserbacteria bacterium CG10_big_fil_rev_8_21_14_0_10_45_20 TaxID=1974607 RepID=A0A2H0UFB8_9BACT|nr:MAG: DNA polymerase III, subunit gamma and tau [Candidatus Kaiserbacteria bacterium CG10_big_fil_rev_8_21_14_0_10_45_20]